MPGVCQEADRDMYQKTGFFGDSFGSKSLGADSGPQDEDDLLDELPEEEEEEEDAPQENQTAMGAALDPLLTCMPTMQLADEDMEKFLQVRKFLSVSMLQVARTMLTVLWTHQGVPAGKESLFVSMLCISHSSFCI